jgi:hypothetical protein
MGDVLHPPRALSELLGCLDAVEEGTTIAIATDLLNSNFPDSGFKEAADFLDRLLADPTVSNADLKGLLNRETSSAWAMELGFDPSARGARRCLEALRGAIARHTGEE